MWGHGFTWEWGLPISRNPRRPCLHPDTLFLLPELAKTQLCSHSGWSLLCGWQGLPGTGMGPGKAGMAARCWAGREAACPSLGAAPGPRQGRQQTEPLYKPGLSLKWFHPRDAQLGQHWILPCFPPQRLTASSPSVKQLWQGHRGGQRRLPQACRQWGG